MAITEIDAPTIEAYGQAKRKNNWLVLRAPIIPNKQVVNGVTYKLKNSTVIRVRQHYRKSATDVVPTTSSTIDGAVVQMASNPSDLSPLSEKLVMDQRIRDGAYAYIVFAVYFNRNAAQKRLPVVSEESTTLVVFPSY
jgi:hypothetical protein